MAVSIVRLGSERAKNERLRLGTVRRPPRGVRKTDIAKSNYYDVWLPELSPTGKWVSWALAEPWTDERWAKFEKNYRREMAQPGAQRLLDLLAHLSHDLDFSVGCYCERADRCHRAVLGELLKARGATMAPTAEGAKRRRVKGRGAATDAKPRRAASGSGPRR
jgi:uncharacterized protein YeaO (DUF488 family)